MNNQSGIFAMMRSWVVSVGSIAILILAGLWIPKFWLPFVAIALQLLIYARIRSQRESDEPVCQMMPFVATRVLFWSAMTMFFINYMVAKGYIHYFSSNINPQNPYITVLVVAPVEMIVALWAIVRKDPPYCIECRRRHGEPVERGFIGLLFAQESKYQLKMLVVLSSLLAIVSWSYYFLFYINVNINTPDRFFYVWVPVIYTLGTFVYMWMRYTAIYASYFHGAGSNAVESELVTRVRFLVFSGDRILIARSERDVLNSVSNKYDTPVSITLPRRDNIVVHEAVALFENATGIARPKVRFMYKVNSSKRESNLFYFIVTLGDAEIAESRLPADGEWHTIQGIQRLMNSRRIDSRLSAAIVRLYTIVMAWKMYDRSGHRRYSIKSYRPSFSFRDIESWDVDYNDSEWLNISGCNEDKRFWRLRRFWHRYVNGLK